MLKCSLKNRVPQLSLATCIVRVLGVMGIIHLFTFAGEYHYPHVPLQTLRNELHRETVPQLKKTDSKPDCNYDDVLNNERSIQSWEVPMTYDDFSLKGIGNGSYSPPHCNPVFSVAILVTYRNRQKQLDVFLPYIHNFLRKQNIHYKIYLIEQRDEKPWNKGLLYNIGAKRAMADRFPCLVLHDVDLLPLDDGNLYACTTHPRHMSASIDKFRYVLPYRTLVGGVTSIRAEQFAAVNGFSNRFTAWGGEDDDFGARIEDHHLTLLRFPRTMSRYTMLKHERQEVNGARFRIYEENRALSAGERRLSDGLDSVHVHYRSIDVKHHRLFTLIAVTL